MWSLPHKFLPNFSTRSWHRKFLPNISICSWRRKFLPKCLLQLKNQVLEVYSCVHVVKIGLPLTAFTIRTGNVPWESWLYVRNFQDKTWESLARFSFLSLLCVTNTELTYLVSSLKLNYQLKRCFESQERTEFVPSSPLNNFVTYQVFSSCTYLYSCDTFRPFVLLLAMLYCIFFST
jgi:hypothetical protein